MSQEQDFIITSLLTKKELAVENNNAILPLFPTDLYSIRLNVNKPNYTSKFRKSVRWDFGDGTVKEGSSATHHYTVPGKYKITCIFYDIDRKAHISDYFVNVIVKEIVPNNIEFCDTDNTDIFPVNGPKNLTRSKLNNLLTLQSTLSNNVKVLAPIVPKRISDNKEEKSYFDIKDQTYYHLERYYAFLKEEKDLTYKKNLNNKITLKPVQYFVPKYSPLYITFKYKENIIIPELYVYVESDLEGEYLPETYNLYSPNASVLTNHYKENAGYYVSCPLIKVNYMKDLPADSRFCGWISRFNIWYKDDYKGIKNLYFTFDSSLLKFYNDKLSPSTLNTPSLGINISVNDTEDYSYALTSNGLLFSGDINEEELTVDTYLNHNLYADYTVEGYLGKYIKNDTYNDAVTWSILKDDNEIPKLTSVNCELKINETNNPYISCYEIKPTKRNFKLTLSTKEKELDFIRENAKPLYSINLPYKNYKYINLEHVLDAYMAHPMYEDKPVIKEFFKQIFLTDELFENINNKGFDFFDDVVNHKTCYIKNLQSILEMLDSSQLSYNLSSFDKINELKELTRILSMQYSELFGQFEEAVKDIKVSGDRKGKNVGDLIKVNDTFVCDKHYSILGIIREGQFFTVGYHDPHVILHNNFNKESRIVSFYGIQSITQPENHAELQSKYGAEYYYKLDDYDYTWGWNLQLPAEFDMSSNKANIIDSYYTVYIYIPEYSTERKYNYIDAETVPYSNLPHTTYITKEEWDEAFGYTYDCLMKVLIYKLGLN